MIDSKLADFILRCYIPEATSSERGSTLLQKFAAANTSQRFDSEKYAFWEPSPRRRQDLLTACYQLVSKHGIDQALSIAHQAKNLANVRAERQHVTQALKAGQKELAQISQKEKKFQRKDFLTASRISNRKKGANADALYGMMIEMGSQNIQTAVSNCTKSSFPILATPDPSNAAIKNHFQPPRHQRTFPGVILIPDREVSIKQAALRSQQPDASREDPGRRYYYTDACVTKSNSMGAAVAWKQFNEDGKPQWVARGCRIPALRASKADSGHAEAWAIWLALQIIGETAEAAMTATGAKEHGLGLCTHAVIYTDSMSTLQHLRESERIAQWCNKCPQYDEKYLPHACILRQAYDLEKLGVALEMRWVKGHAKVPGNELADRVAKKAACAGEVDMVNPFRPSNWQKV